MDMSTINLWAVLVAALSAFLIGGLWYSPLLFANAWMKEAGLTEEQISRGNMTKIFGLAFVFILIMAWCLAMFLNDPSIDGATGTFYGFLAGFGWVFFAIAVNSQYEHRSWRYVLISGGYWIIVFTLMGLILGAWK
jgi:hypothetical protein